MSLPKGAAFVLSVAAVVPLGCGDPVAPAPQVAAPSQVAVRELGTGHIEVSWRDNSDNETAFELVRSSGGPSGPFTLFASVAANVSTYQDTEIDGAAHYCYQVRAVGPSGASSSPFSASVCLNVTVPDAPSSLEAAATFGQVDLTWVDNSGDEAAFEIWRSTTGTGGSFTLIATVEAGVTILGDTGLDPGAQYCYRVRAIGSNGRQSAFSNTACATTPVPQVPPPAAPTALAARPASPTAITLEWTDNAVDEAGYESWRSTDGAEGTYGLRATLGADATIWHDTGLTPLTEYCYRVRAVGAGASPASAFSPAECATTPAPPPPATPTDLAATAGSSTRIDLTWRDNATDEAGYGIGRSTTGPLGPFPFLDNSAADATSFADTGLDPETEYCYVVRALGANGAPDSPSAGPICATTSSAPVVRVVTFGDSNTEGCPENSTAKRAYVSPVPRLGPTDPHLACMLAGKIEAKWRAARSEALRAVNHGIGSTTSGGGGFGGPDRSVQTSPNARTAVNGITRYEAEVLGLGYPWSGGETTNKYFPSGPVLRVNAFVPGPDDFAYVSMGTNDASSTRNMTPAETEANLRWMVERWLAAGRAADHFLVTTLPPRAGTNTPTAIPDRNRLIRALAAELGVRLIDLAAHVSDDDGLTWRSATLHIGDSIHYTDAVRSWLADQVVAWLAARTPGVFGN